MLLLYPYLASSGSDLRYFFEWLEIMKKDYTRDERDEAKLAKKLAGVIYCVRFIRQKYTPFAQLQQSSVAISPQVHRRRELRM